MIRRCFDSKLANHIITNPQNVNPRHLETLRLRKLEYSEYLLTEHWQTLRDTILEDRKTCERCGSKKFLQVHHKTYCRIGCEKQEDLELLCSVCHMKEHNLIPTNTEIANPQSVHTPTVKKKKIKQPKKKVPFNQMNKKQKLVHWKQRSVRLKKKRDAKLAKESQ